MTPPTPPPGPRRRRRWVRPVLAVAFVVVPLVEIWAILQVGQLVGPWWTIVLLVLDIAGIVLILPFTRPVARRLLTKVVERRLVVAPSFGTPFGRPGGGPGFGPGFGTGFGPGDDERPGPGPGGPVVRGDVVE